MEVKCITSSLIMKKGVRIHLVMDLGIWPELPSTEGGGKRMRRVMLMILRLYHYELNSTESHYNIGLPLVLAI